MHSLQEMLGYTFFQRALLAGIIIGFVNGAFGAVVVLRKSALVASSLSHALLPGVAIGILVAGLSAWNAFLGALFAALVVVLSSLSVSRNTRLDYGTSLAVILTLAFAVGVMIADKLPEGRRINLEDYLFGNILNIARDDLWVVFIIGAVTLTLATALQRPILLTLFEPSVAAAQGVPTRKINYLLMTLLVLVMVASLQAVGCILSLVMLVAPAATIYLLTNSAQAMFWGGGLLGSAGAVAGILLADRLEFRPGTMITLILGAFFLAALLFAPKPAGAPLRE
ncbi:MAG: metal ABC transporter permease [Verrucomicrobiales bacterium]|nr:metal ABC transporter permease [Verrucomicrobiales bacterium]